MMKRENVKQILQWKMQGSQKGSSNFGLWYKQNCCLKYEAEYVGGKVNIQLVADKPVLARLFDSSV